MHVGLAFIIAALAAAISADATAQVRERFCTHGGADALAGAGVMIVDWVTIEGPRRGSVTTMIHTNLRAGGETLSATDGGQTQRRADGTFHSRFWDNWGAAGSASFRREGDRLEVNLTRLGKALQDSPATATNYGRFTLTKAECGPQDQSESLESYLTADDFDFWRYRPARRGRGPVAEMVVWGNSTALPPKLAFRVTCDRRDRHLVLEYFPGEDPRRWMGTEVYRGVDINLYDPASDIESVYSVKGRLTPDSIVGRLALTRETAQAIERAPVISMYGENGPSNDRHGGRAAALRRLVRECSG